MGSYSQNQTMFGPYSHISFLGNMKKMLNVKIKF